MSQAVSSQVSTRPQTATTADSNKICWIEVKQYPYQPDHQVELLHLQAEADALLLQLQAIHQKRQLATLA
ncbi:MAG: hypothetical protein AAFU71_06190 [Cyanobacteria bacterium J06632_22]